MEIKLLVLSFKDTKILWNNGKFILILFTKKFKSAIKHQRCKKYEKIKKSYLSFYLQKQKSHEKLKIYF